jgi:LytS/YehU family sensor histidine kinase
MHKIRQLLRSFRIYDADAVLDRLGSLFHRVQNVTSQAEVPLDQELELVRDYLAIEHARFADRLRPRVNASPEALECLVPPLILQPLVENAVRHGISASSSAGSVDVEVSVQAGRLHMTVRDDGPGVGEATGSSGNGTGLRNTEERLKQLYGEDAVLRISSDAQSGTMVRIEMPARRVDETVVESLHV